jgi:50S ribosomal subunit-associated GTPase HflX
VAVVLHAAPDAGRHANPDSRDRGGVGLSTFGSGESSLEKARRRLDNRQVAVARGLAKLSDQRAMVRRNRKKAGAAVIALVGCVCLLFTCLLAHFGAFWCLLMPFGAFC